MKATIFSKGSGNDGSGNGKCNELFCKRDNSCRLCEKARR